MNKLTIINNELKDLLAISSDGAIWELISESVECDLESEIENNIWDQIFDHSIRVSIWEELDEQIN